MRTEAQILADLLAGHLDIADIKVKTRVQIDEIDMQGERPFMTRTRVYLNGEQTEVILYGK